MCGKNTNYFKMNAFANFIDCRFIICLAWSLSMTDFKKHTKLFQKQKNPKFYDIRAWRSFSLCLRVWHWISRSRKRRRTFSSACTRRSSALHKPRSASRACSLRITWRIVLSISLTWFAFSTKRRFICHILQQQTYRRFLWLQTQA